ncbi:MAG: hypothetical protein HY717_20740 [Planctomycetes bacterium]|nr:hypothetical protein [Planctomycetota bacterium]
MSTPKSGKKLTAEEIETLRRWVEEGAPYDEHWSYVKPVRPTLPRVANVAWPRNAIVLRVVESATLRGPSGSWEQRAGWQGCSAVRWRRRFPVEDQPPWVPPP